MFHEVTVRREGSRVQLLNKTTGYVYEFSYGLGLSLAKTLREAAKSVANQTPWDLRAFQRMAVICGDDTVMLLQDGRVGLNMPPAIAQAVANAIDTKAKEIQEDQNAEEVISDQSLLTRHGLPFGITNDKKKLDEAFKQAQFLPKPKHADRVSKVGAPALYPQPPQVKEDSHA